MPILLLCFLLLVPVASFARAAPGQPARPTAPTQAPAAAAPVATTAPSPDSLPVKRVVLYKNGIGYFEHVGPVRGNQSVTIEFTSDQLNDVLTSLTTLDLGGGRITAINYNSEAPLNQRLGSMNLPIGEATTVAQFLGALRGARVEARSSGGVFSGRLLAVEKRTRTRAENQTQEVDELSIVSDAGEVRVVELSPAVSVRLVDRDLNQQVSRYLGVLASAQQQAVRRMTISTAGSGERSLFVSYVSEVPVWKTTYRLIVPSKAGAKPLLQGWAIVDNTIGEDWTKVEMSLVAGQPQSFIQQISQPFYVRRPVVPLPSSVQLTPQTHEASNRPAEAEADKSMRVMAEAPFVGVPGGVVGGVVGGLPSAPPPPAPAARFRSAVSEGMGRIEPVAAGREMGDFFEYQIKEPITVRKNQSALVPIVNGEVSLEKVTVWNPTSQNGVPLRAAWLTNSTGLTLDAGSFTVIESEAFAGEGLMSAMTPGDRRLLSYAADTAVRVNARSDGGPRQVQAIRVNHGVLIQTSQEQERRVYTINNDDKTSRTLVIEHPARPGWKFAAGAPQPAETSAGYNRFRVTVEPKKGATLTVDEIHPLEQRYGLMSIDDSELLLLIRSQGENQALEAALRPVIAKKQALASIDRDLAARKAETDRITQDQARLRENMKALKGSSEEKALLSRYTRQLDEQETRLETLQRETATLQQQRAKEEAELSRLVDELKVG
ncbi:MAG TPA: hypothetical protein VGK32_13975 [Vicinamibacterales bacterium]|jgi:hypothetical protein